MCSNSIERKEVIVAVVIAFILCALCFHFISSTTPAWRLTKRINASESLMEFGTKNLPSIAVIRDKCKTIGIAHRDIEYYWNFNCNANDNEWVLTVAILSTVHWIYVYIWRNPQMCFQHSSIPPLEPIQAQWAMSNEHMATEINWTKETIKFWETNSLQFSSTNICSDSTINKFWLDGTAQDGVSASENVPVWAQSAKEKRKSVSVRDKLHW